MSENPNKAMDRRNFLRAAGGASTAAVAAVALQPTEAAAQQESRDERRKARYRETEHVKAFYRTNRY